MDLQAQREKRDPVTRCAERLLASHGGCITGTLETPAIEADYADLPAELDPSLRSALEKRGIARLYSHQRDAWDTVRAGEDVVVVTPTA